MNTGQLMLTVGALALLSVITLNYFATVGQSGENIAQTNAGLTCITIATSFIERAQNAAFDENDSTAINLIIANHALLTAPGSLGADTDETLLDSLDDFDDFNYFDSTNVLVYSPPNNINEIYHVWFNVYYVDTSNINASSGVGYQTFLKKMDVTVRCVYPDTSQPFTMSSIYGLFSFN